jgi:hypothetical protein
MGRRDWTCSPIVSSQKHGALQLEGSSCSKCCTFNLRLGATIGIHILQGLHSRGPVCTEVQFTDNMHVKPVRALEPSAEHNTYSV